MLVIQMVFVFRYIVIGLIFLYSTSIIGQNHQYQEYLFSEHNKYIMNTTDSSFYKSDGWIKGNWRSVQKGFFKIKKNKIIFGRRMFKDDTTFDVNGTSSTKERWAVECRLKILEYHKSEDYGPDKFYCDSKYGKLEVLISNSRKYIMIVQDSLNWFFHLTPKSFSEDFKVFSEDDVIKKTVSDEFVKLNALETKPSYKGAETFEQSTALFLTDLKERLLNNPRIKDSCLIEFSVSTDGIIQNARVISGRDKQFNDAAILLFLMYWDPGFKDGKKVETMLRFNVQID